MQLCCHSFWVGVVGTLENGFLCETESDWIQALSSLINSEELRRKMGSEGKKTILQHYSVNANKVKYVEVFGEGHRT